MADAIEVRGLTKRFGGVTAVSDLSFSVRAGSVTGFLGPNGAGKTTTLRVLLGLARAGSGSALIEGRPYRELADPVRTVGAALEHAGFHPGRSGRDHLRALCAMAGLPAAAPTPRSRRSTWAARRAGAAWAATRWACASACTWRRRCWANRAS